MKCFLSAVVLLLVCQIFSTNLFASAALSHAGPNPLRRPGGCYEEDTGHLKGGEDITVSGQCVRASCSSDGHTTYASCGKASVKGPGCFMTEEDLSKPYPECCPRPSCRRSD